ncbi:uncharacterized protein TNCT_193581 [Trichonephila clavata]|uniref:C2H2-type domain-containing protein n=1 Tax=Trichonephila clavata TaxID=2740835 RepID=A0A8X6HSA6_TRICU|nr:uncharacterized protein TNCT_193581 [Trichonephila clavata]
MLTKVNSDRKNPNVKVTEITRGADIVRTGKIPSVAKGKILNIVFHMLVLWVVLGVLNVIRTFSTVSNLYQHAKLIHKVSINKQLRCNICSVELISKKALEDHVDLAHNITIEKDTHNFNTLEDFKLWKETIEKQTTSLYVKNTGKYNISSDGILDTNDVVSVTKWVEGLKNREDSPVVLFKDQNIFDEDLYPGMKAEDFLLVIMNASQKDMLKFYGNDTICLDFTHGMNAYGFDLATLLVFDGKREGFPAAFILSNRQDSTALKLAFAAIKEHTCIAPKALMIDDTESFF